MGILQRAAIMGGIRQLIMYQEPGFTALAKKKPYIARAKISDLGFIDMPTAPEIWARIQEVRGVWLEGVGSDLRLVFDERKRDFTLVERKKLTKSNLSSNAFGMKGSDGVWLFGPCVYNSIRHPLSYLIVFVRLK